MKIYRKIFTTKAKKQAITWKNTGKLSPTKIITYGLGLRKIL
jgi:hypothetical protein